MSYKYAMLTVRGAHNVVRRLLDYVDIRTVDINKYLREIEERIAQDGGQTVDLHVPSDMICVIRFSEGRDYTTHWTIDADDVLVCGCGHAYLPDWQCTMAETRDAPAEYEALCPECHVSADEAEPLSDCTAPVTEQDCESADLWEFVDWYRQQD